MNIITTVSDTRFSFNGIQYLKNYSSKVAGNKLMIYNCYDNKDVLAELTVYNQYSVDGIVHANAANLQEALLSVIYSRSNLGGDGDGPVFQDNVDIFQTITSNTNLTRQEIAERVNNKNIFTVAPYESLWIKCVLLLSTGVSTYKYKVIKKGKGTYGDGGQQQLEADNLELVYVQIPTVEDIDPADPTTDTFPFGNLTTQTISEWLNSRNPALVIQPQNEGYVLFTGTIDTEDTSYLWIGEAGTYGIGQSQSTGADFQKLNEVAPPVDNIPRGGTRDGFPVTGPIISESSIKADAFNLYDAANEEFSTELKGTDGFTILSSGIKVFNANSGQLRSFKNDSIWGNIDFNSLTETRTYIPPDKDGILATIEDVKGYRDVPEQDFYIATNPVGTTITYKTDIYRTYQIPTIPGFTLIMTNEIVRNDKKPDQFVLFGNFVDNTTNAVVIILDECKIINNIFTVGSVTGREIPIAKIHAAAFHNGFVYGASRYNNTATNPQKFIKINPDDLTDIKVLPSPNTGSYVGSIGDFQFYNNYLYCIMTFGLTSDDYIVRVDENLNGFETISVLSGMSNNCRVMSDNPMVIYNDEIYVPTVKTNAVTVEVNNQVGISVYSVITGALKRKVENYVVSTGGQSRSWPHWMTIFNGKIILTPAQNTDPRWILRVDAATLALEETIPMPMIFTDDNSLFSDGYMYLNEEGYAASLTARLIKMKYNDFTDLTVEISNYNGGWGSHGSLNPILQSESLKTNLSQFNNDLSLGTPNLEQVNTVGSTTTKTMTVYVAGTPTLKTDIAPDSVKTSAPDGRYTEVTHNGIDFKNTPSGFKTNLRAAAQTADHIATLQDGSGVVAFLSDIPGSVGAAVSPAILKCDVTPVTVQGSTPGVGTIETIIKSYTIPANTLTSGNMAANFKYSNSGVAGTKTVSAYIGNSPLLSSAFIFGKMLTNTTGKYNAFKRDLIISVTGSTATLTTASASGASATDDVLNGQTKRVITLDITQPIYVFTTITLANAGDDITQELGKLIFEKSI